MVAFARILLMVLLYTGLRIKKFTGAVSMSVLAASGNLTISQRCSWYNERGARCVNFKPFA